MKLRYIIIILILMGLVYVVSAINTEPSISNVVRIDTSNDNFRIYRIHDDTTNVTCWIDANGKLSTSNGISCLPDYMLNRPGDYNGN